MRSCDHSPVKFDRLPLTACFIFLLATALVSNAGRLTEARLGRELSEKKIIDFSCRDGGFEILKLVSITTPPSKVSR